MNVKRHCKAVKSHFDGYIQNNVPLRKIDSIYGKLRSDPWMAGKRSPIEEKRLVPKKCSQERVQRYDNSIVKRTENKRESKGMIP